MTPKFIVDLNVGRLAKWLRALGYDALFIPGIEDRELLRLAGEQSRIILTRDRRIMVRRPVAAGRLKVVEIKEDRVLNQLHQVVRELSLDCGGEFSRCIRCNDLLVSVDKEQVAQRVPPYVFMTQQDFMECPCCRKLYWRGTHWSNMRRELARVRGEAW